MKKKTYSQNERLIKSAKQFLVGGVNSPVRAFKPIGIDPIPIKRGSGPAIYDFDNKKYIDYVLSFGALILGHAHPHVVGRVKESLNRGFSFGATSSEEVELAALIKDAIPFIDKVRFVNSGTEAVMGAVRLCRGYTGRDKILKFRNSYHGHADYLLADAGSGLATLNIPLSKGVPDDFIKHTLISEYGDKELLSRIFKRYGEDIAAVIVEPVGGNNGVILPDIDFLKELRKLTRRDGSLLIFDEVITGFRFAYGSVGEIFGINPDIICLGKIIGGGLPIGAFAGPDRIMKHLAPEGAVYQASTFSGNPIVASAGIATLEKLYSLREEYSGLSSKVRDICETIVVEAGRNKVSIDVSFYKSMFSLRFAKEGSFRYFYKRLLSSGIYLVPSEHESNFISFTHRRSDIEKTKTVLRQALQSLKKKRG